MPLDALRLVARPYGVELYGEDELLVCAASAGVLVVNTKTGQVAALTVSFAGKRFLACNNSALAADERSVLVAETPTRRILRIWLLGPEQGEVEVFAENQPGYLDNLASATRSPKGSSLHGAALGVIDL